MALLTAGQNVPLNMLSGQFGYIDPYSTVTSATATAIWVAAPGGGSHRLTGNFVYGVDEFGDQVITGGAVWTITDYSSQLTINYNLSNFYITYDQFADFLDLSAAGQRSYIFGGNDLIYGDSLADSLTGLAGDDNLGGLGGSDFIDGGTGTDTAILWGQRSDFQITKSNGFLYVTDLRDSSVDSLLGIEFLKFDNMTIAANAAPVVSVSNIAPAQGAATLAASALFSLSDADGDPAVQYKFFDGTVGNGRFRLNGATQVENSNITINASDLANFEFATSAAGSDVLWVQAFDGYAWSAWQTFTVAARVNHAPVVAVANMALARGQSVIACADLFASVSDADGDSMTRYRIFDATIGNGRFTVNGTPLVEGGNIEFMAQYVGSFDFRTGGTGSDTLWVQAYDGAAWSEWKSFTVSAPVNNAPAVTIDGGALNPAKGTASVLADDFFSVADADGDAITEYRFFDGTAGNGYFTRNGLQQNALVNLAVAAGDLADFRYVTSTTGSGDQLWVQAYDGVTWGTWKSFNVAAPVNVAPVVNANNLAPAKSTASIVGPALFTVTDPDDVSMAKFRFFDGTAGNGRFTLNGNLQAELANIEINASDLANFGYAVSTTGVGDTLWVQAYDGFAWGAWKSFNVAAPVNIAPTVHVQNHGPSKSDVFIVAGANMFTVTDPDDAVMAKFRFFDGTAGNGYFTFNGIQQATLANIEINASDYAHFGYVTSTTGMGDTLWVQAYDGFAWSAWKSFDVTAYVNVAPTVNVQNLSPAKADAFIAGSALFTVSDPDDAGMTQYRFFDGTAGNGYFTLNGAPQATLANITITAAQLANFRYETSTMGAGDTLWVQAYDGFAWSTWKSFTVAAPVNIAPTVNVQNLSPAKADTFIAGSALFTVTDPDDAGMTQYRFFDGTAGNGRFQLNGANQVELSNIEITAGDLANFRYATSTTGTGDTLWVQAYDGFAWGAWKSFNVAAPINVAPVVSVSDRQGVLGFVAPATALFTVNDVDNDTIARYQFWDSTPGEGHFLVNGVEQAVNTPIDIAASDLATTQYVVSNNDGSVELLWVRANDGTAWGEWKPLTITAVPSISGGGSVFTLASFDEVALVSFDEVALISFDPTGASTTTSSHAPAVTATNADVEAGSAIPIVSLLSVTDSDGDAVTAWQFWDATTGSGALRIGGAAQIENQAIDLMASQLAVVDFLASGAPGVDQLWARASDGAHWGAWQPFTITTLAA